MSTKPSQQTNKLILVTGMHRSGTSALTRVLNLLGLPVGRKLLAARSDNPSGYWEDESVVTLDDAALQACGLSWDDPWPLPEDWHNAPWADAWRERLSALLDELGDGHQLMALKDPRISRLLPAWTVACQRQDVAPHVIICLRHPLEVAQSLGVRGRVPPELSFALWLAYTLEAERASRHLPRVFVRYEDLLEDWSGVAQRIHDTFDVTWPRSQSVTKNQINVFLDTDLRHFNANTAGASDESILGALAIEAYHLGSRAAADTLVASDDWDRISQHAAAPIQQLHHTQLEPQEQHGARAAAHPAQYFGPEALVPTEILAHTLEARLYYREYGGQSMEDHHVLALAHTSDYPMRALFTLPSNARADFIRFDPASMPGIFRIHNVRIDKRVVLASELQVSLAHQRRLRPRHDELLCFYCDDDDPYVELDIRNLKVGHAPLEVEITFDRASPLDALERQLTKSQKTVEQKLITISKRLDDMAAQQAAMHVRLASLTTQTAALARRKNAASRFAQLATQGPNTLPIKPVARGASAWNWRRRALPILRFERIRLHARSPDAGDWWSGDEPDPQFHLGLPGATQLPAGWYVLSMAYASLDGVLEPPILFIDYGHGFVAEDQIPLDVSWTTTRQRLLLHLSKPANGLRLDPRNGPGEILFADPGLRRISQLEAIVRLGRPAIHNIRTRGASWADVARECLVSVRTGGIANTAQTLHSNQSPTTPYQTNDYAAWIVQNDTLATADRQSMRSAVKNMGDPPLISIIVPAYNTSAKLLRECIDSVRAQIYPYWELCIANDASTDPHVREILDSYATRDPRIKVVHRERNGHISAASNSAIELATGDWYALLDHDDMLSEHALFHIATTIRAKPDVRLIYSDEDKITEDGRRYDPYFKPDWNPELFLSQNMVCHLSVYHAQLVEDVGGFREGFEGSQDYDLALRVIECIDSQQITHIPRVLYHWRATAGSTALSPQEKSYTASAARRAVHEHLVRTETPATVTSDVHGYQRVQFAISDPKPKVTLIIPTRNRVDLLQVCVESILAHTDYPNFEILIVDNQSDDPATLSWFQAIRDRDLRVDILRHDEPFNFSRINNRAVRQARGDIVGLINNDIEVTHSHWLTEMVSHAVRDGIGAVGAKLYYTDGRIQHAGVIVGFGGVAGHAWCGKPHNHPGQMGRARLLQSMGAVTAACLIVKKSRYLEAGGMNEDLCVAFNDIDFCLRLQMAGYRNVWSPYAELTHHESASRGYEDTPEKQARFASEVQKMKDIWGDTLLCDPAYNPNLTLSGETFAIATKTKLHLIGIE